MKSNSTFPPLNRRRFIRASAALGLLAGLPRFMPAWPRAWASSLFSGSWYAGDQLERAILGQQTHGDAASFMILTIVASTSCATPSNCGAWNIASRVVGFNVAKMVLPPSS